MALNKKIFHKSHFHSTHYREMVQVIYGFIEENHSITNMGILKKLCELVGTKFILDRRHSFKDVKASGSVIKDFPLNDLIDESAIRHPIFGDRLLYIRSSVLLLEWMEKISNFITLHILDEKT